MALAVVILGWSAGQAHIRRMRNWFLRRRNATLRPPTTNGDHGRDVGAAETARSMPIQAQEPLGPSP